MNNADVETALREIAELLELKNETTFRIRAYENASKALGGLTEDVHVLVAEGRLKQVKGVGESVQKRVEELLSTGKIAYLEELRAEYPIGVRSLMSVPGVGPSLARRVYRELGVDNLEALRAAAEDGRLASLPGFGEKSAENVLRSLKRVSKQDQRTRLGTALPLAEEIIELLRPRVAVHHLMPGGSLRRWAATIGDIDIVATADDAEAVMDAFVTLPIARQVLNRGPTKSTIIADNGLQVDLRILAEGNFGSLLQHFTGSRNHNIELREYALKRGLSLSEHGITDVTTKDVNSFSDEVAFYGALDLEWIAPELREASGEIQAAATGALPELVELSNLRGDLHVHSDWSDGGTSLEGMIEACIARGYGYMAVTDHSQGLGLARGLSPERLDEQIERIGELRKQFPQIRIFTGSEVDIHRDGTLDFSDEVLNRLDWVIASVHSGFNQSEADMTARITRAMENPHVDAIGHPTGRLLGRRDPYALDLEALFRAAARTGTCLEINASPERLDLGDSLARRARELGVMLVINTDAHAPSHLDNMRYGVAMARRGWSEASSVLNTLGAEDLAARLKNVAPLP